MNQLRKIVNVVILTAVLGVVPVVGQNQPPPCSPTDPGIIETPPCASAFSASDDSTNPGQTQTPSAADTVDVLSDIEVALIELLILW